MHNKTTKNTLEFIAESIAVIKKRNINILTADDFFASENGSEKLDATLMRLQAIGEAVKNLKKRHPELMEKYKESFYWSEIIKLREVISHHYVNTDTDVVFAIVKNGELDTLGCLIDKILQDISKQTKDPIMQPLTLTFYKNRNGSLFLREPSSNAINGYKDAMIGPVELRSGVCQIKDFTSGGAFTCHPSIDKSGSVRGMKSNGYWAKDDQIVEAFGCKHNIDKIRCDSLGDELCLHVETHPNLQYALNNTFANMADDTTQTILINNGTLRIAQETTPAQALQEFNAAQKVLEPTQTLK